MTWDATFLSVAAGGTTFSPVDVATTVIFTDPSSLSGVTIKAAHITELQTAVNAMRAAGGLTPTTFSSVTAETRRPGPTSRPCAPR